MLGAAGEAAAAAWYERRGYTVIDRNWRCADGELDVVCANVDTLVVVEVKTRRSVRFGHPVEAITPAKLARLRRLTARYVREHDFHAEYVRIDVAAVLAQADGTFAVNVVPGIA